MTLDKSSCKPRWGRAMSEPWEIQDDEATKWDARFNIFLLMGPDRSIDKAYAEYYRRQHNGSNPTAKRAPRTWMQKSSDRHWVARARKYDIRQEAIARKEYEAMVIRMQKVHEAVTNDLVGRAVKTVQRAEWELNLHPGDAARLAKEMILLNRVILG